MIHQTIQLYKNALSGLSRNVWLLSLIMLVNRSGTMVVPFLGIFLKQQEGFSITQTGWMMSCIGIGSVVGTYIGGRLTDSVGYYGVQFWSLLLSGICFLLMPYVDGFYFWCFMIFLVNAVADAFRPANQAAIGFYSKEENRTRSMSLVRLAINLGFSIGPAVGGIVAKIYGYNWLFILDGLTCITAAFIFAWLLPKGKKIEKTVQTESTEQTGEVRSPYQDFPFLLFVLCNMVMAIAFVQFMMALPIYFEESLHIPETLIGLLLGINGLVIFLTEMPFVYAYEKKERPKLPLIALGSAMIGAAYLVLPLTNFAGIAVVCMLLLTIGEIISFPFSATYALNRAVPQNRGAYMGLYGISWSVALIISPIMTAKLIALLGYSITWLIIGGLPVLGGLGVYCLYYTGIGFDSDQPIDRDL